MKIDIPAAMHDGLGFSAKRFSEVLRIGWLPYSLLFAFGLWFALWLFPQLNPQDPRSEFIFLALYYPVPLLINTMVMVALIQMAVRGTQHHRSAHLAFGLREVLFLLASLLSGGVILLLSVGPGLFLNGLIETLAVQQETQTAFFFTEGSLHEGSENLLYPEGAPVRGWSPVLAGGVIAVLAYLSLRLFLLPVLVAAGSARPLAKTWRAGAGLNVVRLFFLFVVLVIVQFATNFAADLLATLSFTIAGLFIYLVRIIQGYGLDFAVPLWAQRVEVVIAFGLSGLFFVVTQCFTSGLFAGFAGAVVRQVEASEGA